MTGSLYAIGVGPGDPDLLTLKALKTIQSSDLIAYPVGADSKTSLARQIVSPHIPDGADEYGFSVPMRVEREPAALAYDVAAKHLSFAMNNGKNIALLCEGDPFFYGSAMYLVDRLAPDFRIEIVPGVTSLTACAAAIKRPLAARNERLKVLPAPLADEILEAELSMTEAAAIIKVGRHFERVRKVLRKLALDDRAMIIETATGKMEKVTRLIDMPEGERPYFSTILVYAGHETWGQSLGPEFGTRVWDQS